MLAHTGVEALHGTCMGIVFHWNFEPIVGSDGTLKPSFSECTSTTRTVLHRTVLHRETRNYYLSSLEDINFGEFTI